MYAPQSFVCALNPSRETFETAVKPVLAETYSIVATRYAGRQTDHE